MEMGWGGEEVWDVEQSEGGWIREGNGIWSVKDGFEEIEGLTVVDILRRAGIGIQTVSVTGSRNICGAHEIHVEADVLFEECDFGDADMLVLPGGMPGTRNLGEHGGLCGLLREAAGAGRKIAAICAAPSVLPD